MSLSAKAKRSPITGGSELSKIKTQESVLHQVPVTLSVPTKLKDPLVLSCPELPGWLSEDEKRGSGPKPQKQGWVLTVFYSSWSKRLIIL